MSAPRLEFEGVVGGYFLERDSRIHQVVHTPSLAFSQPGQFVPEGIIGPARGELMPVARRVRVLVPLSAREPIKMLLSGEFGGRASEVRVTWNATTLAPVVSGKQIAISVPEELVHTRSRTNELVLDLPEGSKLRQLDFQSLGHWY